MLSDLKFALRSLRRSPGFALVSILILALGIGAVTAVFSAVDAVLLRPLPFARAQDLYGVHSAASAEGGLFSVPEYCAYRDGTRAFEGLAAMSSFNASLVDNGDAVLVQGLRISANAFDVLGVRPAVGRLLVPDDDRPGAPRVAVIDAGLWQRSFGGRPDVVGRSVTINGQARTIVGVLPAGFILPLNGFHSDVCVPLQPDADPSRYTPGSLHFLGVIGRVAPGVTPAQALADLGGVLQNLRQHFPAEFAGNFSNRLTPLADQLFGDTRPVLLAMFGLVGALLLLASTNLAGLHLVRAIGRHQEFALRTALGAGRADLFRFVVAECLLLAAAGGVAGVLLANWGMDSLGALVPAGIPRGQALHFNGPILAFASAVSLGFGLLPALAPVWLISRTDLRGALAAGGRRTAGGQNRARHLLASVQVALALALLACTALFLRSFWAASAQRLGFDTAHALSARLTLPEAGYHDPDSLIRLAEHLSARLATVAGVEKVGATSLLPLATGLATVQFARTDQPAAPGTELPSANYRLVTPDYFAAMGIPLREGRGFTDRDDRGQPLRVIIGSTLADAYFPNHTALGRQLELQDTSTGFRTAEVVGIVDNVKQGKVEDGPTFDVYVPYRQMDPAAVPWIRYRSYWVVRGTLAPAAMEAALRREVRGEDAGIALSAVRTLAQVTQSALAPRRFTLVIVGFFAGTALLLTVAGIYSVTAFGVAQRTREIGVRLALGAKAEQIRELILREGMLIVAVGAPVGLLVSFGLARLIATQLYGVTPHDPLALGAAVILIASIAFLACWLPARKAARVDPIVALRAD